MVLKNIINHINKKTFIVLVLVILEFFLMFLSFKSYGNKNLDKYIFGINAKIDKSMMAIMIEESDGKYNQSNLTTFPDFPYIYNQELSVCEDASGNKIENAIIYDEDAKKVSISVSKTSMCYFYFMNPKEISASYELINSGDLWSSGLEGDGLRYVGSGTYDSDTTPNNFICFGTTSKTDCKAAESKYMYRIIGVFPDEEGNQHLKLRKFKQLKAQWHSSNTTDTNWQNSTLYTNINASSFLTNSSYDYLQNSVWLNKIVDWQWTSINTLTKTGSGVDYAYTQTMTPKNIYLHEMNRSTKTINIGAWTNPKSKIGLINVSDYVLSLGDEALAITSTTAANASKLKTGWLHYENDGNNSASWDWTLSRMGLNNTYYTAWFIYTTGVVTATGVTTSLGYSPVFFLDSDVSKASGTGTYSDPYLIETTQTKLSVDLSINDSMININITKGTADLKKYCINQSSNTNDCVWRTMPSANFDEPLTFDGIVYVHVLDKAGYIAHKSIKVPTFAEQLIVSDELWNSGLEGDGYRYVGTGPNLCSYNDGEHQTTTRTNITSCSTLYNYIRTKISSGETTNYTYKTSCPSDTSTYTYSCTTLPGTLLPANEPANYICFGTTSASECKANESEYMYRIIGVFPDEQGNQHLKLRKFKQLGDYAWHSTKEDKNWGESTLYTELNGSSFLGNTTYDYLQNATWSNKIENWKWTAVNTKTYSDSGPNYSSGSTMTPANIYLHEMNRSTKTSTVGEWTYPTGKIGLIYASDYVLSLGDEAIAITGSTSNNAAKLKTGWLHYTNNLASTSSGNDWTIARYGAYASSFTAWCVNGSGYVSDDYVTFGNGVAPVFYLTTDIYKKGGTGTYSDPYTLSE